MSDLQAHNCSMWRQNLWDLLVTLAGEDEGLMLFRLLTPLPARVSDELTRKAREGVSSELTKAIGEALDDYEAALRAMFGATQMLAEAVSLPCRYCGEQSCQQREEHDRWYRASETTVREQASAVSAVGVADTERSFPSGEQSAAAERAAGIANGSAGPAVHLSSEGGAGADTGRSVPARGEAVWCPACQRTHPGRVWEGP